MHLSQRPLFILALSLAIASAAVISCKKYHDEPGQTVSQLSRKYCNDPEAVNYNLNFPGTADNSVCYYPADAFSGNYRFTDSIYNATNSLALQLPLTLQMVARNHNQFDITGFCPGGAALHFTANRSLHATGDTTVLSGQILCRSKDTVSGYLTRSLGDSTRVMFYLTVVSDTGTTIHQGTAYRQ
jgi:hypothetical protein